MAGRLLNTLRQLRKPGAAVAAGGAAAAAPEEAEAGMFTMTLSPALRRSLTRYLENPESVQGPQRKQVERYLRSTEGRDAFARREQMRMADDYTPAPQVLDREILDPEQLVGRVGVPVMGDRSIAGSQITGVEGVPLESPVALEGGPNYGLANRDEGVAWASQENAARTKQNQITRAAEETGLDPVGVYTAMGNDAMAFNTMATEAMLGQIAAIGTPQKAIRSFNSRLRKTFPDFAGIDTPEGLDQLYGRAPVSKRNPQTRKVAATSPSELRKGLIAEMSKAEWADQGFPVYEDVVQTLTEPALRDARRGDSGFSIFEGAPGAEITPSRHGTYSHDIPGRYLGGLEESVGVDAMFPDLYRATEGRTNRAGNPLSENERIGAVQMGGGYQRFDQEWLDNLMRTYEKRGRRPSGFPAAAGAAVIAGGELFSPEEAEAAPFGTLARLTGRQTREVGHVSPHEFDQFDRGQELSGEGAAAYGSGAYAYERESTGDHYRRQFSRNETRIDWPDEAWAVMNEDPVFGRSLRSGIEMRLAEDPNQSIGELLAGMREFTNRRLEEDTAQLAELNQRIELYERGLRQQQEIVKQKRAEGSPDVEFFEGAMAGVQRSLDELIDRRAAIEQTLPEAQQRVDILNRIGDIDPAFTIDRQEARTYRLEVPDEDLLDWDMPISEQPEAIQSAVRQIAKDYGLLPSVNVSTPRYSATSGQWDMLVSEPNGVKRRVAFDTEDEARAFYEQQQEFDLTRTGQDFYRELAGALNTSTQRGGYAAAQRQASDLLDSMGIPGLRFDDGMSRGDRRGDTHNYVVFSDRNVNMVTRDGEPIDTFPKGRMPWTTAPGMGATKRTERDLTGGRYAVVEAPIDALLDQQGEAFDPRVPSNQIGNRLQQARDRLELGLPMDPPMVGMTDQGTVMFDDGRHRTLAARELGETTVPVLAPVGDVDRLLAALPGARRREETTMTARTEPRGQEGSATLPASAVSAAAGAAAEFLRRRMESDQPSGFEQFLRGAQENVGQAMGMAEVMGSMVGIMGAEAAAGYMGLMEAARGGDAPAAIERTRQAAIDTFRPRSERGQQAAEQVAGVIGRAAEAGMSLADMTTIPIPGENLNLGEAIRHFPGYWENEVVPALQRQLGDREGSAVAAFLRSVPEAL